MINKLVTSFNIIKLIYLKKNKICVCMSKLYTFGFVIGVANLDQPKNINAYLTSVHLSI